MKKLLFFALTAITISSCHDYKPEIDRLNHDRDSLINLGIRKDSTVDSFLGTLNGIESNLDSINRLHQTISMDTKSNPEMGGDVKQRINQNIENINKILEENKKRIEELAKKLKNSNVKLAQLKVMVEELNKKIAEKDSLLADLRLQLDNATVTIATMKSSIDTLNSVVQAKTTEINDKVNKLQTAFWTMGDYKSLRDKKVVNKEGGFLGLGKKQTLVNNFDESQFTKIDILQNTTFEINKKSAKIISVHPSDAYKLDKNQDMFTTLTVTDPDKFWRASKYLVIVTN